MRTNKIVFQFDVKDLVERARRVAESHVGDVTINLPFVSIPINPKNLERRVAQELVIRLRDRRILNAQECCDSCIDHALCSLQEIRRVIVDKQVELVNLCDGGLYLLTEAMALGIRQFLTFEQKLNKSEKLPNRCSDFHRKSDVRQKYFDGLEILRGHLSRCLEQIAVIAKMDASFSRLATNYHGSWQIEAYKIIDLSSESN